MNAETLGEINFARQGKTLVMTNGVFDLLHAGHVQYLHAAKNLGDLLVVALNSDASVKRLDKAPDRPLNTLEDRMAVIAALRDVDFVVSFEEDTPERIIAEIRPDIHCKGGDYDPETMPETPVVRAYGGRVVVLPFLPAKSTTSLINRIRGG